MVQSVQGGLESLGIWGWLTQINLRYTNDTTLMAESEEELKSLLLKVKEEVHRVGDAIQPSHPLSSPSPTAPNPSQHQSLFQ